MLTAAGTGSAQATWGVAPQGAGTFNTTTGSATTTFTTAHGLAQGATITLLAIASGKTASASVTILTPCESANDWEARAIVGYHQAGASSAKFTQNFFFDFFIMRALSSTHLWGKPGGKWYQNRFNVWGDVRVASTPQQITTGVGQFVTNFSTQVSNVPVNQLAQSADFQSGLEYRLHTWARPSGNRMIGFVADFGALGEFQPPDAEMQIFNVPSKTSAQYADFAKAFPTAANATYVGFVPPNRERFYRSYGGGFRITTFASEDSLAPPATYMFTAGQDELITGGIFRSVVGRFDVFYPLKITSSGKYNLIYLFGTANLRLSKATTVPTFALQNPNALNAAGQPPANPIQPYDPGLAVVTVRATRDTYRIGVGVDLVNLIQSIAAGK